MWYIITGELILKSVFWNKQSTVEALDTSSLKYFCLYCCPSPTLSGRHSVTLSRSLSLPGFCSGSCLCCSTLCTEPSYLMVKKQNPALMLRLKTHFQLDRLIPAAICSAHWLGIWIGVVLRAAGSCFNLRLSRLCLLLHGWRVDLATPAVVSSHG